MREFIVANFEHVLCVLILISRLGDIVSTYLVTPKLKLEANPIVRKLGWSFAIFTLFACLIPYWNTAVGIIVLIASLLVSAANTSKIWFARAYGEQAYVELIYEMAGKSKLSHALAGTIVSALFIAMVGLVTLFLCPNPGTDWGYFIGWGILTYAFVVGFYGSLSFIRIFKMARKKNEQQKLPPVETIT
jgi:hypothetical protein